MQAGQIGGPDALRSRALLQEPGAKGRGPGGTPRACGPPRCGPGAPRPEHEFSSAEFRGQEVLKAPVKKLVTVVIDNFSQPNV